MLNPFSKKTQNILSSAIFLLAVAGMTWFKFTYHELWKDEWQAWFVVQDKSLTGILSFLNYEGHPALWYLFLVPFTYLKAFFLPEDILTAAHMVTVVLVFYLLFRHVNLPLLIKTVFAFSYFISFEYGVVNRGYMLVVLLALFISWILKNKTQTAWMLGVSLFLLCQTEVYGTLMAIAFGFYIYLEGTQVSNQHKKQTRWGLFAGLVVFVISVFPRSIGHIAKTRGKELSFLDNILTAFQGNLSNTYMIGSTPDTNAYGWSITGLILSAVCLLLLIYLLRKNKSVLLTMLLFVVMMAAFSFLFFLGGVRQWGMGFIFLFAMVQLMGIDSSKQRIETVILLIFGLFSCVHGAKAFYADYNIPFTNAKEAGHFIRDKVPEKVPVVSMNKFETTPVLGYAGRSFYELPSGNPFTYFRWVDRIYVPTQQELMLFCKFRGVGGIIIISPKPIDPERFPAAQLWTSFTKENYKNENYYLYTLKREMVQ
jgi:hypothetical protein